MAASVVQVVHNDATSGGGTIAVTITGVTANNGLVALVTCSDDKTLSSVSDGTTNFNADKTRDATNEGQQFGVFSLANSPSGSRTITATFSGTATSNRGIQVLEVSGVASAGSGNGLKLSGTPSGNDSGAGTATAFDSAAGSTITTTDDGALVIGYGEGDTHQPVVAGAYSLGASDTNNLFTSEYQVQGTRGAINPSFTLSAATKWAVVAAAYAPSGGPTTVSTTDTATLTEGTPLAIAVSGPTDSLSLAETATVGPQASDVLSLDDAAFTIVATEVASINDFTLSEGPIVIGVGGPSDALSLAEGTVRIVATISISDVLTLDDSNVTVTSGGVTSLTETDTLTLGEFLSLLDHAGMGDAATLVESVAIQVQAALQDSASLTERASVAGTMALSDSLSLAESLSIAIVGGFTGYAKGTLVIVARLAGTVSVADRLKGSTAGAPRLRGTQTTQPVGPP